MEIVPQEGKNAMGCLKKYRECLLACANETPDLKVMDLKQIVYTMYPNLYGLDYGRGKWDFDHPLLSPLKTFFDKYLK